MWNRGRCVTTNRTLPKGRAERAGEDDDDDDECADAPLGLVVVSGSEMGGGSSLSRLVRMGGACAVSRTDWLRLGIRMREGRLEFWRSVVVLRRSFGGELTDDDDDDDDDSWCDPGAPCTSGIAAFSVCSQLDSRPPAMSGRSEFGKTIVFAPPAPVGSDTPSGLPEREAATY